MSRYRFSSPRRLRLIPQSVSPRLTTYQRAPSCSCTTPCDGSGMTRVLARQNQSVAIELTPVSFRPAQVRLEDTGLLRRLAIEGQCNSRQRVAGSNGVHEGIARCLGNQAGVPGRLFLLMQPRVRQRLTSEIRRWSSHLHRRGCRRTCFDNRRGGQHACQHHASQRRIHRTLDQRERQPVRGQTYGMHPSGAARQSVSNIDGETQQNRAASPEPDRPAYGPNPRQETCR